MMLILNVDVPTEVDEIDFTFLSGITFILKEKKYLVCKNGQYRNKYIHRLVALRMGLDITNRLDHEDQNPLNNKRNNIRYATVSQNAINSKIRIDNSSGHKGVWWDHRTNRWTAELRINGTKIWLGRHRDFNEACRVREEAEIEYFKEFRPQPCFS